MRAERIREPAAVVVRTADLEDRLHRVVRRRTSRLDRALRLGGLVLVGSALVGLPLPVLILELVLATGVMIAIRRTFESRIRTVEGELRGPVPREPPACPPGPHRVDGGATG